MKRRREERKDGERERKDIKGVTRTRKKAIT